ncbi:unnamed protein product [Echinostoma caproni]|uniref:Carbonic anhydrase n=1 Tax=Echinostoma caproni TaxID=27848 RepID=A0A183AAH3_9TREM|nr:unnamed protein product [Echinostoma caproni]
MENKKLSNQLPGGRVGNMLAFCSRDLGFKPHLGRWIRTADKTQPDSHLTAYMERLIKGALAFTRGGQREFIKHVNAGYTPAGVLLSCVDARVFPSKILGAQPGELLILRNAGNFAPEHGEGGSNTVLSTLELGCLHGKVKDVVICGHSDCKAMHLLCSIGSKVTDGQLVEKQMSPLQKWVAGQGIKCWKKWQSKTNAVRFPAFKEEQLILNMRSDLIKNLEPVDIISQINVLQQMSNVYAYPLLAEKLAAKALRVHGFWFSVHAGQMYVYNPQREGFVPITEETLAELVRESAK